MGGGYKFINIFVLGGYKYINIFVWGVTYIFLYSYPPNTNIEGLYVFKPQLKYFGVAHQYMISYE